MVFDPPAWVPQDLYPFVSRFTEVGGCNLHYVDEGAGPALVMVHGNPTWSFLYRDVILGLRDRFRCIAVDLPGFGLSKGGPGFDYRPATHTAVLTRLLERLDLQEFYIFGHDWGGPIGLSASMRHISSLKGVVLANTWAWALGGDPHFERFSKLWNSGLGQFLIRRFNLFVRLGVPMGTRKSLPRKVMRAYRGPFPSQASRQPIAVLPRELMASTMFLSQLELELANLRELPALLLWGEADPFFRVKELKHLQRLFPRARTVQLREVSHFIQEDAPASVVSAVKDWHSAVLQSQQHGPAPQPPAG